ncbi:response regulator transcription factor [Marivirga sp. S37H4]|uniref:Response regulator transcription factor n=1 Tax=Marivirga aurantiaca TaxID=2802615 RepID=A0A935CAW5_9BACT|nr:LytTR family DNA-binding domain-containing protein [Marivirga aurantiaca]MBK6266830.1 response regulator transcription factor [Marivirga aurantiaca]
MNYVIIEDEFLAAQLLEKKIKEIRPKWRCIAKLESVVEATTFLNESMHFDLLFCDIHLSDGNSFEIFEQVNVIQPVIFTTAFDKYAIEAFKVHSIHYLLKPIKKNQLEEAIDKFESQNSTDLNLQHKRVDALLQDNREKGRSRFLVKKGQNMRIVPAEEIAYFYSSEGLTYLIHKSGEKLLINETLEQLEAVLNTSEFFRANRQYIIHISSIAEIEPYFKGKLFVHLIPKQQTDCVVSQAKATPFKEWVNV